MAGITLAQAQAHLDYWMAEDLKNLQNYNTGVGDISVTKARAEEVRANIKYWDRMCKQLSGRPGLKVRGVTPV